MGMLSRIANSLGEAGMAVGMQQLKSASEQELLEKKDAMDQAREQRIIEAQAKITEAANARQDGIRLQDHGWSKEASDAKEASDSARELRGYAHQDSTLDKTQAFQKPVQEAQVAASYANIEQSQAATAKANEELKSAQKKNSMLEQFTSEADPQIRAKIANDIAVMSGKDPEVFKQTSIDTGSTNKDGTPVYRNVLMDMSDPSKPKLVEAQPQWDAQHKKPVSLSDADIDALATDATNKQLGVRNSTSMFIPGDGVDNTKQYDSALEANKVKIRSGMLNQSKSGDDVISGNNFGNAKTSDDKSFATYDTPAAGINAIADRFNRYAKGITTESNPTGKPATTLSEFTAIYAPRKDNNNPTAYADYLAKSLGIDANTKVDLTDPEIQKVLIPEIIRMEKGAKTGDKILDNAQVKLAIASIGADKLKDDETYVSYDKFRKGK